MRSSRITRGFQYNAFLSVGMITYEFFNINDTNMDIKSKGVNSLSDKKFKKTFDNFFRLSYKPPEFESKEMVFYGLKKGFVCPPKTMEAFHD